MAGCPGPAADEFVGRGVALSQDFQGGDQFALEEIGAPAVVGEGGEGCDDGQLAAKGAIGALKAPDGDDDGCIDVVLSLDFRQQVLVGGEGLLAKGDTVIRDCGVKVVPDGLGELVLVAVLFHDGRVEPDAAQGGIKDRGRDACSQRAGAESGDPGIQARLIAHRGGCHGRLILFEGLHEAGLRSGA